MNELRSYEDWAKSLNNFSWLKDAVPGASDIDLVLHAAVKGSADCFLFMEFKPPGAKLPLGQRLLFDALRKESNKEVVIVYGPDRKGLYLMAGSWKGFVDKKALAQLVKNWWKKSKKRQ